MVTTLLERLSCLFEADYVPFEPIKRKGGQSKAKKAREIKKKKKSRAPKPSRPTRKPRLSKAIAQTPPTPTPSPSPSVPTIPMKPGDVSGFFSSRFDDFKWKPTADQEVKYKTEKVIDDQRKEDGAEKKAITAIESVGKDKIISLAKAIGEKSVNEPETREIIGTIYTALHTLLTISALNAVKEITAGKTALVKKEGGFITPNDIVNEFFSRLGTGSYSRKPLAGFRRMMFQMGQRLETDKEFSTRDLIKNLRAMVKNIARDMAKEYASKLSKRGAYSVTELMKAEEEQDKELALRISKIGMPHLHHNIIKETLVKYLKGLRWKYKKSNKDPEAALRYRVGMAIFGPMHNPLGLVKLDKGDNDPRKTIYLKPTKKGIAFVSKVKDRLAEKFGVTPKKIEGVRDNLWDEIKALLLATNISLPERKRVKPSIDKADEDDELTLMLKYIKDNAANVKDAKAKFIEMLKGYGQEETMNVGRGKAPVTVIPSDKVDLFKKTAITWRKLGMTIPQPKKGIYFKLGDAGPQTTSNINRDISIALNLIEKGGRSAVATPGSPKPMRVSDPNKSLSDMDAQSFGPYIRKLLNINDVIKAIRNWLIMRNKVDGKGLSGAKGVNAKVGVFGDYPDSFNPGLNPGAIVDWLLTNNFVFNPITKAYKPIVYFKDTSGARSPTMDTRSSWAIANLPGYNESVQEFIAFGDAFVRAIMENNQNNLRRGLRSLFRRAR